MKNETNCPDSAPLSPFFLTRGERCMEFDVNNTTANFIT
jgi:hypothetical protein